jgi:hypothetical protein
MLAARRPARYVHGGSERLAAERNSGTYSNALHAGKRAKLICQGVEIATLLLGLGVVVSAQGYEEGESAGSVEPAGSLFEADKAR